MSKKTRKLIVFIPLLLIFLFLNVLGFWVVFAPMLAILILIYLGATISHWVSSGKWDWNFLWNSLK